MVDRPDEKGMRRLGDEEYEVHHAELVDCPDPDPDRRRWSWLAGVGVVVLLVGGGVLMSLML